MHGRQPRSTGPFSYLLHVAAAAAAAAGGTCRHLSDEMAFRCVLHIIAN